MRTDEQITDEIRHQVRAFRPGVYSWLAVLATAITLPIGALVISLKIQAQALEESQRSTQRSLCPIVITQDDAYRANPPTTPRQEAVAAGMAKLRHDYRCDETP